MLIIRVWYRSIRALPRILLFGSLVCLFSNCDEEKAHERSYPRVSTSSVSDITAEGATFNAEIYSLGTEQIIEHGFVWSKYRYPDLTDDKILLGPASKQGAYKAEVVTSLITDVEYTVKSFVQTAGHIVYGQPVTFKSLGSGAPVILGLTPDSAAWLDTIKISGKNFSYDVSITLVKFNQTSCSVISASDTLLIVELSPFVTELKNVVSVEISGNISVFRGDSLRLIPPELHDFAPEKAYWGDTLQLKGKHFRSFSSRPENTIYVGSVKCERVGQVTDTAISVRITDDLSDLRSDLSLKINGFNLQASNQFELLPPYFTFAPESGTWGSTITLTGRFNGKAARNTFHFLGESVGSTVQSEDIVSTSLKIIRLKVPISLSSPESKILYQASPFSVTSADTFHLNGPVITSFSPLSGSSGINLTIRGKYFDLLSTIVRFAGTEAVISSITDSVIVVIVPTVTADQVKIGVTSRDQIAVSTDYFQYINPKITAISPITGTFYDEITITGENFVSPSVSFEDLPAEIVSSTSTKIVIKVPVSIDSIPKTIHITCGSATVFSTEKFTLSAPQITSVSPEIINPGQDFTISGTGFNPEPERNIIFWDIYPLTVRTSSKTEIVATWPQSLPRGNSGISINVGGYIRTSSQKLNSDSKWLRVDAPNISTAINDHGEGLSINAKSIQNYGYLYSLAMTTTYTFNPVNRSWNHLPVYQGMYAVRKGEVVCRDTFYLILGVKWVVSLDQDDNLWRDVQVPPILSFQAGIAFSLNNRIYFGLDYNNPDRSLYECDPGNNYTWTRLGDFPIEPTFPYTTYFSVGNKGYVVFSDNSVWQFDPDLLQWTRKSDFPGSARKLPYSFVIENKAFMGSGQSITQNISYNDLWEYDPATDTWTFNSIMPGDRQSAVSFSIGNKAYVGFGLQSLDGNLNQLYDFYEFDPNYPAK